MKNARTLFALIVAALIGSAIGDAHRPAASDAASLGVSMICTSAVGQLDSNGNPLTVTQYCKQAASDTSGLTNVTLTFTSATQRYALNTVGTVTLP